MECKTHQSRLSPKKVFTRDFVQVFLSFFLFQSVCQALVPAVPIYLTGIGFNARQIGILIGVMGMAALISRFLSGAALIRYSEKRIILAGVLVMAISLLSAYAFRSFILLFIVRLLQGVAFAGVHTAAFTYAVRTIPKAHQGQGIAYFTLSTYFSMALSAPFGIFLINKFGFFTFFSTFTGVSMGALLLSLNVADQGRESSTLKSCQLDSKTLVEWKIIAPSITAFLQMFVFGAIAAFFPLYAIQSGVLNPGLFFTASAVIIILGRAFAGKSLDVCNRERMIAVLILIMMVAMIMLSFSDNLLMFIFVGMLYGFGLAFFMPASMIYAFEYSGCSGAPAVATFNASFDFGIALGPAVMGPVLSFTGYPMMFFILALICLLNLFYFQIYVKKRWKPASKNFNRMCMDRRRINEKNKS